MFRQFRNQQQGMTLMELLIAISLLTVMMTLMGIKINQVYKSIQQMKAQTARIEAVNLVFTQLSRELQQLAERPINTGFQQLAALVGDDSSIEFTHNAKTNQLAITQDSNLERVKYSVVTIRGENGNDDTQGLLRETWKHLDRKFEDVDQSIIIAQGFESINFEYLDPQSNSWQTLWNNFGATSTLFAPLPLAIKLTVDMPGVGKVDRSFLIPANRFQ